MHLTPIHFSVTEKEAAIFYCSLNCSSDHSLLWLVGETEASHLQPFTATSASRFRDKTGIHVEVKDQSTCNDNKGKKQQVLTIHSSILHPMLLIRCVAQPITPNFSDAKSNYATLRVHPVTGKTMIINLTIHKIMIPFVTCTWTASCNLDLLAHPPRQVHIWTTVL